MNGAPPDSGDGPSDRQRFALLVVGMVAFLCVGALQASFGPTFPVLQERYGVSVAQVGGVVSSYFVGTFVGVLGSGALLIRLGYRRSLVSAAVFVASGTLGLGLAATWLLVLGTAFVAGLGFGQISVAGNLMVARAYGRVAAGPLNALAGMYGVGAMLAPALVAFATMRCDSPAKSIALVVGAVGVGALVLLAGALLLRWLPVPLRPPARRGGRQSLTVLSFMAMFFLYVASEVSNPTWIPTHLDPRLGSANAALVASGYWAAFALGRFLVTPLAARVPPRDLVLGATALTLAGLLLAQLPALAVPGYVLAGFGLAPVFPTTIAWLQWSFGDRGEQVTPMVIAAGNLGPVLGAPLVGVVVAATSVEVVPTALAGLGALLLAGVTLTWLSTRSTGLSSTG